MEFLPRRKSSTNLSLQKKQRGVRFSMDSPTMSPAGCSSADEAMIIDSDNENDVPETGLTNNKVLKDVVAYVEVRTKMENRSNSVCKQLERLGAVVVKKFTNDEPVTHVVWKDGKKSTKDKAIKRGLHLVSVLWVDSCKQNQRRAEESLFPVTETNDDATIVIPRVKRMKSMQPKSFEEDLESSTERMVRKRKKKETVQPSRLYLNSPVTVLNPLVYAAETQDPFTPVGTPVPGQGGTPSLIPDTPASMRACLDALSRVRNSANTPTSGSEKLVIGESPTSGGKSEVPPKKLSFSPSTDANSLTDSTERKTDPKNKLRKGRRSEGQGSAKKDSSKTHRLSLRIEKTLSEQETDEDLLQPNKAENLPEILPNGPVQALIFTDAQKICSDSNKLLGDMFKTQLNDAGLFCETNMSSHAEPQVTERKKRRLLSTNADVIPNQVLMEPTKSSMKEKQQKRTRLSGKSSKNLGDKFEKVQGLTHQESSSRDEGLAKDIKSSEFCGKSNGKSPCEGKNTRKRKKEMSSESSGEDTSTPVKRRRAYSDNTSPSIPSTQLKRGNSTPNSRRSLDDFAQNKRLKQLKKKQQTPRKSRSASLSTLNPVSEETLENGVAEKSKLINNNKSARLQSLAGDSTMRGGKRHSSTKPSKTSRTNSNVLDGDSDSSSSSSEIDGTSRGNKPAKATKSSKKLKNVKPSLVMTSVHAGDQDLVTSVVKKLKGFTVEDNVSLTTTHIICGESRRTLNLLHGIARGCWLLSIEWVLKSLEAEMWLPEESYEILTDFPAAKISRLERSRAGSSYKQELLSSLGPIYVSEMTTPSKTNLVELIQLCSGVTCSSASQASLCIGGGRNQTKTPAVSEKWLLDCITQLQRLPFDNYLLQ